ncbi:MAG: putative metal-dependent hydrolase [bacterium]
MPTLDELRFPIGKFTKPTTVTAEKFKTFVNEIAQLPADLRASVSGLSESQLDSPYRDGGWTVRQVVHHLFDSHANSFIRLKLALTEDTPIIKPYDESLWAEHIDSKSAPVETSLNMIDGLHARWAQLLRSLSPEEIQRQFSHPESGLWRIDQQAAMYAWHGKHHRTHITSLRNRMGW